MLMMNELPVIREEEKSLVKGKHEGATDKRNQARRAWLLHISVTLFTFRLRYESHSKIKE